MSSALLLGAVICLAAKDELLIDVGHCRVVLQTDVHVDGVPVVEIWKRHLKQVFDKLDRNRDGSLDPKEARFSPPPRLLLALWRGDLFNLGEFTDNSSRDDSKPAGDSITWEKFWDQYHNAGVGRVEINVYGGVSGYSNLLSAWLFTLITGDRTEPLTPAFLASANQRMRRLDLDDNEWFDIAEFLPVSNNGKVARPTLFRVHPQATENARQHVVQITDIHVDVDREIDSQSAAHRFGNLHVDISVDLVRTNQACQESKLVLAQQLDTINFDNDDMVTLSEASSSPYAHLVPAIQAADLNGDRALDESERQWLGELLEMGAREHIVVSVVDRGCQLFAALDEDGDGRLSRAELASAWQRLAAWDRNEDGRLEWTEVATRIELTFGRGNTPQLGRRKPAASKTNGAAPDWFIAMDVNQDGHVSRREFLGPIEAFRRMDANRDELIDLSETKQSQ